MLSTQAAAPKGSLYTPTVSSELGAYSSSLFASFPSSEADYDKIDMILESPGAQPMVYINNRVLGTLGIAAITYLTTVAGPTGSEPVVSSAGPLIGLSAFVVYPIVYAFPFAYIVAELCSIFPEDGGFSVWVLNAFGPFWGFQVGFWSWVASVFNSALLPGMILKVLRYSYQWDMTTTQAYLFKAFCAVVLAFVTLLGTKSVGRISIAMMLSVVLPFVVFTIWAYSEATEFDDLGEIRHESTVYNDETKDVELSGAIDIEWTTLLNTLFWNYSGVNIASVFGGEVSNPARAYRHAIIITMVLTVATYLIPMPAAICSNDVSWSQLDSNSYAYMAVAIGGTTLQALIVVASVCANAGQYMATLYSQSFMISGMAENELVPLVLGSRNARFGSPHVAILGTMVVTLLMLELDLNNLVAMTNAFSAAVQLLIIATAIHLRRKLPYVARPTKVPGGMGTLYVMGLLPVAMFAYMVVTAVMDGTTAIIMVGVAIVGVAYGLFQCRRHRISL